ncbi:MAG: hypothetical protein J0L63_15000 [Anaerolineae bacterium]|nr:hypothetical protein [Anaerolineae bacterium]
MNDLSSGRARTFADAPLDELLAVLLRQLRRPLAAHHVDLTDAEAQRLAAERVQGHLPSRAAELTTALEALVAESEAVLQSFGLTFQQSLDADMSTVGGWETTAEFLEIANQKANAELRITLGAALALVFGADRRHAPLLFHLAAGAYDDETIIARRVLSFVSAVPPDAPDWLQRLQAWLDGGA